MTVIPLYFDTVFTPATHCAQIGVTGNSRRQFVGFVPIELLAVLD
jgi:hypothetical protein